MFPFEIDETSDLPLWVQLRQRIAYLITSGYFKPGEKLPTVRGLASEISINYNTVNKAYLSLVSDGFLESTRGRGVFVTDIAQKVDADEVDRVTALLDDCIEACREVGMSLDEIDQAMTRRIRELKIEEARREGKLSAHIVDFPDTCGKAEERGA